MSAVAQAIPRITGLPNHRAPVAAAHHLDPLSGLDRRLSTRLGVDLRLIYGMGVPMLCVLAAMIAMFGHPTYMLVGAVLVLELLCLSFIIIKSLAMLGESDGAEARLRDDPAGR